MDELKKLADEILETVGRLEAVIAKEKQTRTERPREKQDFPPAA